MFTDLLKLPCILVLCVSHARFAAVQICRGCSRIVSLCESPLCHFILLSVALDFMGTSAAVHCENVQGSFVCGADYCNHHVLTAALCSTSRFGECYQMLQILSFGE